MTNSDKPEIDGNAARTRVTFLVSQLKPLYGLEKAVISIATLLEESYDCRIVALSASVPPEVSALSESLGAPVSGLSRVRTIWRIVQNWSRIEADVIILCGLWAAIPWLLVRRVRKTTSKVIVWEHSLIRERVSSSFKFRILKGICVLLYKKTEVIVAVSPPLQDDLNRLAKGSPVMMIPNVSEKQDHRAVVRQTKEPAGSRILMVGSLTPLKRHELALRAFQLTPIDRSLTILGDGPQRPRLEALVSELGLRGRVSFAGYVQPSDIAEAMSNHDVLLHCSVVETFGLVLVEAAEAGLAVVSTSNRTSKWLIPRYVPGVLCEDNPRALAEGLAGFAALIGTADTSSFASENRARQFGEKAVRQEWERLIRTTKLGSRGLERGTSID